MVCHMGPWSFCVQLPHGQLGSWAPTWGLLAASRAAPLPVAALSLALLLVDFLALRCSFCMRWFRLELEPRRPACSGASAAAGGGGGGRRALGVLSWQHGGAWLLDVCSLGIAHRGLDPHMTSCPGAEVVGSSCGGVRQTLCTYHIMHMHKATQGSTAPTVRLHQSG